MKFQILRTSFFIIIVMMLLGCEKIEIEVPEDNQKPVITITGPNPFNINELEIFVEPGVSAVDPEDGDVPVITEMSERARVPGTHPIIYRAIDRFGAEADSVERTLIVNGVPRLRVAGGNPLRYPQGREFIDPGVMAYDIEDGELEVVSEVSVDTSVPGTNYVRYQATDSQGATTTYVRQVLVIVSSAEIEPLNEEVPVITIPLEVEPMVPDFLKVDPEKLKNSG